MLLFFISCDNSTPSPVTTAGISKIIATDIFEDEEYIVYAYNALGIMQAYSTTISGTHLDLELLPGQFPNILTDQEGNIWNLFGTAVSGPRLGQQLTVMNTMMGYWFSFAAIYPEVTIYGEEQKDKITFASSDAEWLIDPGKIIIGTFKDGIQSLDHPELELFNTSFKYSTYVKEDELVVVYHDGDQIRVFPHKILDWHEVVNDVSGLGKTVLSYCPLTGTACLWSSHVAGNDLSFGVSGLLYNSNLVLYDRLTGSNWPQMLQKAVNGELIETTPTLLPLFEMTMEAVRMLDDQVKILSEDTGFGRDYDLYPYGDYRTNNDFISYPLHYTDDRVPQKERVLAVLINGVAKVYRFEHFE